MIVTTDTDRPPTTAARSPGTAAAAVVGAGVGALGIGVAVGVATSYLQGHLDGAWDTVANSGAVWAFVAFPTAAVLGRSRAVAAVCGALVLLGEVVGYYAIAGPLRDIPTTRFELVLWTAAALWLGPVIGYGGRLSRRGTAVQRAAAVCAMCGVFTGEGLYLWRVAGVSTSGWVEAVCGLDAAITWLLVTRARPRTAAVAVVSGLVACAGVYVAYVLPLRG